jgi:hypothetical protein
MFVGIAAREAHDSGCDDPAVDCCRAEWALLMSMSVSLGCGSV